MQQNIKLVIAYDGTNYLGWQKTNTGPSIEEALQRIIEQVLQEPVTLQAAGRTDAGVHANGQVANFHTTKTKLSLELFKYSLNCLLPKDIVIREIEHVKDEFHPTTDSIGKEYRYTFCNSETQLPQYRYYSWHCPNKLDFDAMHLASRSMIGEHDFSALCNVKKNATYENHVREVTQIRFLEISDDRYVISVNGNHFLYKMVRNIVGTLIYVGRGILKPEAIAGILQNRDRTLAGVTAPAHGLSLHRVFYS